MAKFSKHFNDAPVVEVSGRSFPVEVIYNHPDDVESDRDQMIVDCLQDIHTNQKAGDVLIFLSGEREIREVNLAIKRAQLPHTEVVPLYARLSLAEQSKIFSPHRGRRIVLSTNVAETSLTVPGIRYVIDTGRASESRAIVFAPKSSGCPSRRSLRPAPISVLGAVVELQMASVIRLYSEEDFQGRPAFTDPEIIRTNLAAVILQMLHLRIGDIRNFPFVDPPDQRMISDGFKLLEELQAVTRRRQIEQSRQTSGEYSTGSPLCPHAARERQQWLPCRSDDYHHRSEYSGPP